MENVNRQSRLLSACVEDGTLHLDVQFEARADETDEQALARFYRESGLNAYAPAAGRPAESPAPRRHPATAG